MSSDADKPQSELNSREMSRDIDETLEKLLVGDKKATDIALILLTKVMTREDYASDFTPRQVLALSMLQAVQDKVNVTFLGSFLLAFIRSRKSVSRKSRKEYENMYRHLEFDAEESRVSKFKKWATRED